MLDVAISLIKSVEKHFAAQGFEKITDATLNKILNLRVRKMSEEEIIGKVVVRNFYSGRTKKEH
jgi:hypothetical protein